MAEYNPEKTAQEMVDYGEAVAMDMIQDMDPEECVVMVRDFCRVMAEWQPNVAALADEPVMLGITCLSTAKLFELAFKKAYTYTDKKVDAINAINKAFES